MEPKKKTRKDQKGLARLPHGGRKGLAPIIAAIAIGLTAQAKIIQAETPDNRAATDCESIRNDAERLKCFDNRAAATKSDLLPVTGWTITEKPSPLDDSKGIIALLPSIPDEAALGLRCIEGQTSVIYAKKGFYFGAGAIRMVFRLNATPPKEGVWEADQSGDMVFAPDPLTFIETLPDDGKLFVRAYGMAGTVGDATFMLGAVSRIIRRVAQDCHWPIK